MKKKTLFIANWHDFSDDKWDLFVAEKGKEITQFKQYYKDNYDCEFTEDESLDIFPIEKEMDYKGNEYKIKLERKVK